MAFICPRMEEMERNRAALEAITRLASDLKKDYECFCEYVPPPPPQPRLCNCDSCGCPCAPKKPEPEPCEPPQIMVSHCTSLN